MKKQKPQCKYGDQCYRQNPQHLREYSHAAQSESEVKLKTGTILTTVVCNRSLKCDIRVD